MIHSVNPQVARIPRQKKVIGFSWDLSPRTLSEIADHADEIAELGLDGIALPVDRKIKDGKKRSYSSFVYGSELFEDPEQFWSNSNAMKRICSSRLTDNFVSCALCFEKRTPFDDKTFWENACVKLAMFARLAKITGAKGLLIDVEDYLHSGQFYWLPAGHRQPLSEARASARERGKELMEAVRAEYPDCKILTTWLLSNQCRAEAQDDYNGPYERGKLNLFVPFMEGLVDGLGPEMILIDGEEGAYGWEASRRDFHTSGYLMKQLCPKMLDPGLHWKYALHVKPSFGLYLDSYTFPLDNKGGWVLGEMDGSRLRHFEMNLRQALEATDEYVWFWGEHYAFANWEGSVDGRHIYPTWEEALPGFSDTIKFLKSPREYGERLYRDRLSEGTEMKNLLQPTSVAKDENGGLRECPSPWSVRQRERADGYTGRFSQLERGGKSGGVALKAEYVFAGDISLPGFTPEKGAIYRASVWVKYPEADGFFPCLKVLHTTKGHPIWNDGGGWASVAMKHAEGNGIVVFPGPPEDGGWREIVAYFRGEPFDESVSLSVQTGRRLFDDEFLLCSDPSIVKVSK